MHDQSVYHSVSTVTSTGSDVSVSNTTAKATEQEFTLNSNRMYPFSLHEIRQGIQYNPTFWQSRRNHRVETRRVGHQHPSSERVSTSFIHDELSSDPLTQDPAHKEPV